MAIQSTRSGVSVLGEQGTPVAVPAGVSIAAFAGFDADGHFLVRIGEGAPLPALSTVRLGPDDDGAAVAVLYESGAPGRLVIVGRLQTRDSAESPRGGAVVDGERVVLRAGRELELRCGDASIVLTRAGKVLIKGNFVLTRSRGANKIKGAYVDIN